MGRKAVIASSLSLVVLLATSAAAQADSEKVVVRKSSSYGTYLADDDGHAVYMFTADRKDMSACHSACAQAWPPMMSSGAPVAGTGVRSSLLGTIPRDSGMQVTYAGMPLYYFVGDKSAGATTGQGIEHFGGKWYLVAPAGQKIDDDDAPKKTGTW